MTGSPGIEFLGHIGVGLGAALLGGATARALGLPVLVGYLVAGIAVGPHTPGVMADEASVRSVADLGVALLMFAVGTQFSLEELNHVRRTALIGGGAQMLGTALLGMIVGLILGWGVYGGLFLGCALALSSTAVMIKVLEERGELGTSHGNAMLGILVVQDLSLIPMAALLPALPALLGQGGNNAAALTGIAVALLKAAVFVGAAILLATRGAPAILGRVARTGSRELFLLTAVCLCLAAGYAAESMGLGLALGAFLAGLVISASGFSHEVLSQVRPLRDVFASAFFVSIGMLLDPVFLLHHLGAVAAVAAVVLIGKPLITAAALRLLGWHGRPAVRTGLGLAQIGEFSFVLATLGSSRGLVDAEVSGVILSAALVSLLLAPFVYGAAEPLYRAALQVPFLERLLDRPLRGGDNPEEMAAGGEGDSCPPESARAVVLGAGRVGRYVSDALRTLGVPHAVVDYDGRAASRLRGDPAVSLIYGDATSETVLSAATPECAALAVVALPEADSTEMAVRRLKRMAPEIPIVVRVHRGQDIPRMRAAGADAVVHAEFEAATEMIRQSLTRLGIADTAVRTYIEDVRQYRYREAVE